MSGERREPMEPGDDELATMLGARASRVGATDARDVLAGMRVEIAGASAFGSEAGERGGRTFSVRPVRIEPEERGRGSRMPWRLAVLGVAAVVAVAVLGSRLGLGPTNVDTGGSPSAVSTRSPTEVLTPAELDAGVLDGSLTGKTVIVVGRLERLLESCRLVGPPADACWGLVFHGRSGRQIDLGSNSIDDVGRALAVHGGDEPIALHVLGSNIDLLGWVVDGTAAPVTPTSLDARSGALGPVEVVLVEGWLAPAHGDAMCVQRVGGGCDGPHPRLTDSSPFLDGTWTYGVPGVDVAIPEAFGLEEDNEVSVGRFLVGNHGAQFGGYPPPYRVVAALDAEVQRVDPQVTPIDATPPPSPSVAPAGERMTPADFERGVRLGKFGERIVVVEGRMRLVIGRCLGTSDDCTWLQLEGLPNTWIAKGDLDVDEAGAAIRRHPNVAPIALRVSGYGVELIGWITAGASTPVEIAALLAGDLPLDPGEVVVVAGWVVGARPDPPCAATPETCAMWPLLQAQAPRTGMEIGYGVASMATMVADSLGLGPAPAFRAGPFLVGARRAPAAFEPGIEVVGWFTDVVVVDPVPSESASPIPSSTPTPSRATPTYDPARSITNDELMTALGNGSLDGRLLLIEAELGTVAWPCPADVPEPCTRFFVDGLPGIALTYDGMVSGSDGSDGGAGVSGMTGTMVVVPRNGHLKLLGRLDEDLGSPVDFGPVFAGTADPITDGFEVTPVPGWLMREAVPGSCPTPAPTGEPGSTAAGCTPAVDVLSDGPPSEAAAIHYAVNEDGGPGLEAPADVVEGPFLVRPGPLSGGECPPESEACSPIVSYGWQVLARYDPADIVQVNAP